MSNKALEVCEDVKSEILEGDDSKSSSLYDAVLNDMTDEALQLLESGAAVNVQSPNGNTVLHVACERLNESIVDRILKKDVDVDAKDKNGNTALHVLANTEPLPYRYGGSLNHNQNKLKLRDTTEKLLLLNGADVNACNNFGQTPLHCASEKLNDEIVKVLLRYRADTDVRDTNGNTALHLVIKKPINSFAESDEIVRLLLEDGANVHVKDGDGQTALHYVVNTDDVKLRTIFTELLIWGGSLFTLDENGERLLDKIIFPKYPMECKRLQKPLVEYIIALQCADFDCSDYAIVQSTLQFENFFPASLAKLQIEKIKATKCCRAFSYSLYDVFSKYRDPIFVTHTPCLESLVSMASFKLDFLDYGSLLKAKFAGAQKRYKMMSEVHVRFTDQLPNEVVWKILTLLGDEDLEQLSIAVSG